MITTTKKTTKKLGNDAENNVAVTAAAKHLHHLFHPVAE